VRRVIEELQGKVWCETADLGGARFAMALPEGEADK
jgi:signal transduction histidine kinase